MVDIVLEAADWDLFAFSLTPLFLMAFEAVRQKGLGKQPARYTGLALAVMVFHTLPLDIIQCRRRYVCEGVFTDSRAI